MLSITYRPLKISFLNLNVYKIYVHTHRTRLYIHSLTTLIKDYTKYNINIELNGKKEENVFPKS